MRLARGGSLTSRHTNPPLTCVDQVRHRSFGQPGGTSSHLLAPPRTSSHLLAPPRTSSRGSTSSHPAPPLPFPQAIAFADAHLQGRVKPFFRQWRRFLKQARLRKRVEKKARRRARKEAFAAWRTAREVHLFTQRRALRAAHRATLTVTMFLRAATAARQARRARAQATIVRACRAAVAKARVRDLRRHARFLGEVVGYLATVQMRGVLRRHLKPWHRALLVIRALRTLSRLAVKEARNKVRALLTAPSLYTPHPTHHTPHLHPYSIHLTHNTSRSEPFHNLPIHVIRTPRPASPLV